VQKKWQFDTDFTQRYTKVRQDFTGEFLAAVRQQTPLESAADIGCGVGYFSKFLSEMGFRVVAIDGRAENVAEGARRYPEITFLARNVEDAALPEIGMFDFVLCAGLLYHLENPFRAIRNLHSLTLKVLMVETMCAPGNESSLQLLDEYQVEDQSLNCVALYPTEACLVKMLFRAGFPFVYRFKHLPSDQQFNTSVWRKRARTIVAASKIELVAPNIELAWEPVRMTPGNQDPWTTTLSRYWDICAASISNLRVLGGRMVKPLRRRVNPSSSGSSMGTK
jgi:SAM-dependent methyltransferase